MKTKKLMLAVILSVLISILFGCSKPLNCPTTNRNYFRQAQKMKPLKENKNWYKCPPKGKF